MERPVSRSRERSAGQQRELRLTEERPPRPMARAALTSDARKKGGGSEWRSHVPGPKGLGWLEVQVREGLCRRAARKELEGEVADSLRRSEVSRVDHVTVDNAVLDAP